MQSRLVREHGDVLVVEADARAEGIVTLRHVSGERDACHAEVLGLDEDARAWVRRALHGTGPEVDRPALVPLPPIAPGPGDPLARGRGALDEWDYDGARFCFEEAFARRPTFEAATALLELLVDHLGLG